MISKVLLIILDGCRPDALQQATTPHLDSLWQGGAYSWTAQSVMPAPWRWLGNAGRIVPGFLGNPVYDLVQRNRFRWFGKRDACLMPDERTKRRLIGA